MDQSDKTVYKRSANGKKIQSTKGRTLTVKCGDHAVTVTKAIRIGRDKDNDMSIPGDPLISRHHALIELISGVYTIKDLGSTNGTYINGNPLKKNELKHLQPGDEIKVGATVLNIS